MFVIATWTVLTLFVLVTLAAFFGIPIPAHWARTSAHRARTLTNRPDRCVIPGCGSTGTLLAMARPDGVVGAVCGRCAEELAVLHGWERLASRHARAGAR